MRRAIGVVTLGLLAALPGGAFAAGFDVRVGGFFPRAESNLFRDPATRDGDFDIYRVGKSDLRGATGGVELSMRLARNVELGFFIDGYGRSVDSSYRDYTRDDGSEIRQTLKLDVVPVGVSLRLVPTGHHVRIAPYVAVGADLFFWNYEEVGDFIDFGDASLPIVPDHFKSDGVTPGVHAAGGVRVALSHDIAAVGEVRYQLAKEKDMGGDFFRATNKTQLDLSGASATIGIHVRF